MKLHGLPCSVVCSGQPSGICPCRRYIRTEMLKQMKQILAEKKLDYVQFYLIFVPEILPDSRTGKKPLILQKKKAVQDEKS